MHQFHLHLHLQLQFQEQRRKELKRITEKNVMAVEFYTEDAVRSGRQLTPISSTIWISTWKLANTCSSAFRVKVLKEDKQVQVIINIFFSVKLSKMSFFFHGYRGKTLVEKHQCNSPQTANKQHSECSDTAFYCI